MYTTERGCENTHRVTLTPFHVIVIDMYLLHDPAHVVFIGHASQLQVDGNIFANVSYSRYSLQRGRKTERKPTALRHIKTQKKSIFAVPTYKVLHSIDLKNTNLKY